MARYRTICKIVGIWQYWRSVQENWIFFVVIKVNATVHAYLHIVFHGKLYDIHVKVSLCRFSDRFIEHLMFMSDFWLSFDCSEAIFDVLHYRRCFLGCRDWFCNIDNSNIVYKEYFPCIIDNFNRKFCHKKGEELKIKIIAEEMGKILKYLWRNICTTTKSDFPSI